MANNNSDKTPQKAYIEKTVESMKNAYSYLHPDYRTRKLLQLILIVPMMFLIYGIIWGLIFMKITGMNDYTMPLFIKAIDLFFIIVTTIISAYFYPFSAWWYKQSFIGTLLNSIYHVGSYWIVVLKIMLTLLGGVAIAGTLAPIMGPLTLRKCKKKNMIIGDATDFN